MNVVVAGNMVKNVRRFIFMQSGEGLIKIAVLTFSRKKNINEAQFQVSFLRTWEYANKLYVKSRPRI